MFAVATLFERRHSLDQEGGSDISLDPVNHP
jgi:hypothetical protein